VTDEADETDETDAGPDDQLDDLAMLLTYAGAVDDGGASWAAGAVEIAPEILQMPFWTPAFCRAVIRAADLIGFEPDPDDPVPGHEVSLAAISPVLYRAVEHDVGERVWPQLQAHWPLIEYRGLRDAFVIRYRPGEQQSLRVHQDIAQVSATVRLNEGYEGASLAFPRQRFDNVAQPVGSLLAWPSLVTHPHGVGPLRSGVKYALTMWCELPGEAAIY
jgi:hypothetical protein